MVKALFDSNILIDHLKGIAAATAELGRYEGRAISIVTWVERLTGATPQDIDAIRAFLERFDTIPLDQRIAEMAASLRREHRVRLPDAVIWASARSEGRLPITRNTKDFPSDDPGVRCPYVV
ncbi:MAG: type II toxin-antitoxin system VapC family toxin [Caulobacteraceae bacterium]